jgi:2'-5' RNA ligase
MITLVETAVVLLVPVADPLLERVREQVGAPPAGMPAHITLLYPFAPDPDAGLLAELAFFFSGVDGFPLTFREIGEFPGVVYLAPAEARECTDLTTALARRWPELLPYQGRFDAVVPHLTVVKTKDEAVLERAREAAGAGLPIRARITEASLWARDDAGWRCVEAFPMAPVEPEH